jgi:hypothetical protein
VIESKIINQEEPTMSDTSLRAGSVPSATSTKTAPRRRDTRTFWRLLLAIVAPLPMLCMGTVYVLKPFEVMRPSPTPRQLSARICGCTR